MSHVVMADTRAPREVLDEMARRDPAVRERTLQDFAARGDGATACADSNGEETDHG